MRFDELDLGTRLLPYEPTWQLQREVHAAVADGTREDVVLLCEHEDVYTAGKRTASWDRPVDGTPVVDVDRGGKITWHGPGQLVGYPILRLPEPLDVVSHVRRLEEILIDVLQGYDVHGYRVQGRSGVWVRRPLSEDKVAAIGVRVQRGVTMHGFALNCDNSLAGFRGIVPCGIADAGVTTLSELAGADISPVDVVGSIVYRFQAEYTAVAA